MPGNRFNVSELWDGVKKSTADAWNEASQGAANLLKQIQELTTRHLPQIAIILRIVTTIPILIRDVRDIGKALPKGIEGVKALVLKGIQNAINRISKFTQGALRNTEKVLRSGFNAAIKPLPKTIQDRVKSTLKPLLDGLKNAVKDGLKQVGKLNSELTKLRTFVITQLGKNRDAVVKGVKAPIDALGKLLKTDIAKIPKLIENKIASVIKAVQKVPGDIGKVAQKVGTDATKVVTKEVEKVAPPVVRAFERRANELNKGFTDALKRFDKAADAIAAKTLQPIKAVQKSVDDAGKAAVKVAQKVGDDATKVVTKEVEKVAPPVVRAFERRANELGKGFTDALKRFDDSVHVIQKSSGEALEELKVLPKKAAQEVTREVQVITKEVGKAGEATAKTVGKSVDDVGKSVGKMAPYIDDIGKQFPKVASHLDDLLKTLGTVGKTVTSMVPIIEGIAEQINFEEIFQRLERIETRIDKNIWEDILDNRTRIDAIGRKVDRLLGSPGTANDLRPITQKLDQLIAAAGTPRSGTDNAALAEQLQAIRSDLGRFQPTSPTAVAEAVAARIPKAQTDNAAIATAVAAKLPKPIDNTAILTKVIQDSIKAAPPGQTVSSEAIAAAVAAKIPKQDNNGLAAVVKTALAPSLQAIDAKLPDNGIYRVDQTGIANVVKEKLGPDFKAIQPTKIPDDLARKSDVKITVNPTPITVKPTPVTVNPTPVTVNPTPVMVNTPPTDLSPINAQLKDISKAIGVDQLKSATPVNAEQLVKQAGMQQFAGGTVQGVTTIAGLMAAFAAPQFFRSGSHRLGGTFDQSVMNPKQGKVQIDDAMAFQQWQFRQVDERMGMPTQMQIVGQNGAIQTQQFRSIQDSVEEINGVIVSSAQDIEIVERYLVALTQDLQKLMQIALQTREDVDVLIDDSGCKTKEVKRSHPTHIKLTAPGEASSLTNLFQQGQVHYVARQWDDSADKNQKLERMGYDTQIAAMSNKFEFNKTNPELPLQKSRATDKPVNDELWRTYVSTMEEPPEGYTSPGNPIPDIKEIKNGNPRDVPRPTNPLKKLGKA